MAHSDTGMSSAESLPQQPSRTPASSNQAPSYQAQWKAFALRRDLALALLVTWLPAAFLFSLAALRHGLRHPLLSCTLLAVWLLAALAAAWWAGEFRCPRCQRRYAALGYGNEATSLTRGLFDKACANCKLTRFEQAP